MPIRGDETKKTILAASLLAVTSTALGAGFYSPSVGTPGSLGTAGVANPTNTRGADASWTNPAGMTGIDQGRGIETIRARENKRRKNQQT
jgi:long-subunit fatty acid transport protein